MTAEHPSAPPATHSHVFLGAGHAGNERRTWSVVWLCGAMMLLEIVGGSIFGSLALIADGLHMSTHAGALLLAAVAYRYARRHAEDPRFVFGTGKLGDLAGFTSAIVLAMIALLIGYEAVDRLFHPVAINFGAAIPVACLGLAVNIASAWLLGGDDGDHPHEHGHAHDHAQAHHGHAHHGHAHHDHDHGVAETTLRDNNMRAAYVHVMADAAVSVLAIIGLSAGRFLGWVWMDPMMGIVGAVVIANWSWGLLRATGSVLLDMAPDRDLPRRIRAELEADGDQVADLHVWRVGPGHLGAIVAVATTRPRPPSDYKARLGHVAGLSHVTVEVQPR
jgi:cation diffusion facilitator family transporter